ncbi:MAG: hypothetical protein ACOY16_07945 [Chloroflexota bacterium]
MILVTLAIMGDLWLLGIYQKRYREKIEEAKLTRQGVFILGRYSPLLTWIRSLFRSMKKKKASVSAVEVHPVMDQQDGNTLSVLPVFVTKALAWIDRQGEWLQILILLLCVLAYCSGILDLGTKRQLPGNESELFQAVIVILMNSLRDFHRIPLWNPYIHTGLPYIADPMLHIYNPVVTVPALMLGVLDGYKVALFLSFFLAAVGMWRLGRVFGFGKLPSLWVGLMYAFAGQPVARFFQGEYLFIFGFAYIPWIIVNLYLFLRERKQKWFGYSAFSIALLYLCGNLYYPFLMLFIIGLFSAVMLVSFQKTKPFVRVDKQTFFLLILMGLLTIGLVAIHVFPAIQFRPWVSKGTDVQGSHTLHQIWLDYTSKDTFRPDAYQALPAREEFYAYIGFIPFMALLLLPLAIWKRDRRLLIFWGLVILFVYCWVDVNHMPWRDLYYNTSFLNQFRHVLRPLIFGSMSIFILGGYGIDTAWKILKPFDGHKGGVKFGRLQPLARYAGLIVLFGLMTSGVWDVYQTNRKYVNTVEDDPAASIVTNWLRQYDSSTYYVRRNPTNGWYSAMLAARLHFIDMWYHFADIRKFDGQLNLRAVEARPHYLIQSASDPPPEDAPYEIVNDVEGNRIYHFIESLPMAFKVKAGALQDSSADELKYKDVNALTPLFLNTDRIELITEGEEQDILVVLVTNYPGWKLTIDDQPAKLERVGGYLATPMLNGVHKYRFDFKPVPFYLGSILSLISLVIGIYLIREDFVLIREWIRSMLTRQRAWLRGLQKVRLQEKENQKAIISAIYHDGTFQLSESTNLANNSSVYLFVISEAKKRSPLNAAWRFWQTATLLVVEEMLKALSLAGVLFILGIGVYLVSRLIGLTQFPIYFFTDEAIQTVSAADLVRDHFYSPEKIFLPTYFQNGTFFNLSLSVYVQVIPHLIFGKSIFVTRAVSVILSLFGMVILAIAARSVISRRVWWSLLMFISLSPAWFLHSRTAFETVIFCSFYAAFIGMYLLYRNISPRYIYGVVLMGALAFYSYSPGQVVLAVTVAGLFFSDLSYHWRNRSYLMGGVFLAGICAYPYFRFLGYHNTAPLEHLRNLDSYWTYPIPLSDKISRYVQEYIKGLSPLYWFGLNPPDLVRHVMKGYGHIGLIHLPFVVVGFLKAVRNYRQSTHRVMLISFLAVPSGSALVGIGITRVLVMVVPMGLLAVLGVEALYQFISQRWSGGAPRHFLRLNPAVSFQLLLFLVFLFAHASMLVDCLKNAPTWYEDYGLYGMQYGAQQIFGETVPRILREYPQSRMLISSSWANGTDVFVRFFLTDAQARRVTMGSIDTFLSQKQDLDENQLFLLTADEFRQALASPKMRYLGILDTIPYPNGKTGFYLARFDYVQNVDQYFQAEKEARKRLNSETIEISGAQSRVRYSQIDSGSLNDIFDGDIHSLMRGLEANPFILEFTFLSPFQIEGIQADFGSMDFELWITVYTEDHPEGVEYRVSYKDMPPDPHIEYMFPQVYFAQKLRIEIKSLSEGETAKIHIREIELIHK